MARVVGTDRRTVRDRILPARPAVAPYQSMKACSPSSSHPTEEPSEHLPDPPPRPIGLDGLCIFEQPNCTGELRILKCRRQTRHRLRVRYMRGHFKNFFRQIIDAI